MPSLRKESPGDWNRLFHNDGGLKFTDVTERAGVQGGGIHDRRGRRRLRQRRPRRSVRRRRAAQPVAAQSRRRHGSRTSRRRQGSRTTPGRSQPGWFDYDNDGWLDLFVVNYVDWTPRDATSSAATAPRTCASTATRSTTEGLPNALYRNRHDGTFEDVIGDAPGIAAHIGQGDERRVRRLRWRRVHRRVRHQRRGPGLPLSQPRQRHVRGSRAAGRRGGAGARPAGLEHGRRLPGLRQRWPAGPHRDGAHGRDVSALQERQRQLLPRRDLRERTRRGQHPHERMGRRARRFRQRWIQGSRRRRTRTPTIGSRSSSRRRTGRRNALFRNVDGRFEDVSAQAGADFARRAGKPRASASAISTATAGSTSSSACSASGRSCCTT